MKSSRRPSQWKLVACICTFLAIAAAAIAAYLIEAFGPPPRLLAPYIVRRVTQHNAIIVGTGHWVASTLLAMDRGSQKPYNTAPPRIDTEISSLVPPAPGTPGAQKIHIATVEELLRAISQARPGHVITLAPGTYRFKGRAIEVRQPGTQEMRVVVRAERPGTVDLELNALEGFLVSAPFWTFENLTIRGACSQHASCEHAFHIVGDARHFAARNNTIVDFNAHFKINRHGEKFPDAGIIEGNTLTNRSVRNTYSSVTPIDLVAANGWRVRRNLITDFIKGQSDKTSYGAFAKGAGADNRFEQNVVICENLLQGVPGRRVGLSIGGGGTYGPYCRDGRCVVEQERGVIEANLIASCSDEGIYINRGARSRIVHNTVIDTAGIMVRFPESSADIEGNLVDASIRTREEGIARKNDNIETSMLKTYLGMHPVRNLFQAGSNPSFLWADEPPRRSMTDTPPLDLCGSKRPGTPAYGAFEQYEKCLVQGKSG